MVFGKWHICPLVSELSGVSGCTRLSTKPMGSLEIHNKKGLTSRKCAPVAKIAIVCTLLSLAATRNWPVHKIDVHNAFLDGDLTEKYTCALLLVSILKIPNIFVVWKSLSIDFSRHPDAAFLCWLPLFGLLVFAIPMQTIPSSLIMLVTLSCAFLFILVNAYLCWIFMSYYPGVSYWIFYLLGWLSYFLEDQETSYCFPIIRWSWISLHGEHFVLTEVA